MLQSQHVIHMTQDPSHLNPGPEWLAHRYDPSQDSFHFQVVDRALRRTVPFLTDDYLPQGRAPLVVRREMLNYQTSPLHFIFHSAYCCSTLLANGLDSPGIAMTLKEPLLLNDLVGWRQRGAEPTSVSRVLDSALSLLARPFDPCEATIIKPSNVANGLATAIMALQPHIKAILLYAPLEAYLVSIARKGMTGRLWVRELLSRQLIDGLVNLGFKPRDYLCLTDLQVAAVGWLTQFQLFAAMATRWPERIRTLDSEALIDDPVTSLTATSAFFDIRNPAGGFAPVVDLIFRRNAKDGTVFLPDQRSNDRKAGRELHQDEIQCVSDWAKLVAKNAGLPDQLPSPLIA